MSCRIIKQSSTFATHSGPSATTAATASSNACFARWHARSGLRMMSWKYTAKLSASPRRVGCVGASVAIACRYATLYASSETRPSSSRELMRVSSAR